MKHHVISVKSQGVWTSKNEVKLDNRISGDEIKASIPQEFLKLVTITQKESFHKSDRRDLGLHWHVTVLAYESPFSLPDFHSPSSQVFVISFKANRPVMCPYCPSQSPLLIIHVLYDSFTHCVLLSTCLAMFMLYLLVSHYLLHKLLLPWCWQCLLIFLSGLDSSRCLSMFSLLFISTIIIIKKKTLPIPEKSCCQFLYCALLQSISIVTKITDLDLCLQIHCHLTKHFLGGECWVEKQV